MIQAIDVESASRICSGQVVVDLATAVKELIENAVDAGATCISVHLKERGIEQIEVTDNGSGIVVEDYALIARKHYTSKLKIFSDLDNVSSFGFRGGIYSVLFMCFPYLQFIH